MVSTTLLYRAKGQNFPWRIAGNFAVVQIQHTLAIFVLMSLGITENIPWMGTSKKEAIKQNSKWSAKILINVCWEMYPYILENRSGSVVQNKKSNNIWVWGGGLWLNFTHTSLHSFLQLVVMHSRPTLSFIVLQGGIDKAVWVGSPRTPLINCFYNSALPGSQLNAQLEDWLSKAQSSFRPARAIIAP